VVVQILQQVPQPTLLQAKDHYQTVRVLNHKAQADFLFQALVHTTSSR
jgi:hypothetical protein